MCDWGKVEYTHTHLHTRNFTLNCYVKEPVRWNFHTNLLYLYISHEGLWGETLRSRFRRSQPDSVPGQNSVQGSSKELKCQACVTGSTFKHFVNTESRWLFSSVFYLNSDQVKVSNRSCDAWLCTIIQSPTLIPTPTTSRLFLCRSHTTTHTHWCEKTKETVHPSAKINPGAHPIKMLPESEFRCW